MTPSRPTACLVIAALVFNQGCSVLRPKADPSRPPALNEKVRVVGNGQPITMFFLSTDTRAAPPPCRVTRVEGTFGEMHGDSLILNRVTRVEQVQESDVACRPAESALVMLSAPGGTRHAVERPTSGVRGAAIALGLVGLVAAVVILNGPKARQGPDDCSVCP